jgi:DNA-binding NtrC family response regulator
MERPTSLLVREHLEWLVETATERTRGNIKEAAKLLGVDRTTLSHWVNRGLSRKYYSGAASEPAEARSEPLQVT